MATKQGEKLVNPANKERKKESPYAFWTDPRTRWKYSLIKSWQAHNEKYQARWFVWVEGYEKEYGDTFVADLLPGVLGATDLVFDTAVWPNKEAFLAWAKGGA